MQHLTLEDLDRDAAAFDAAVAASPDIDRFCSSTDWVVPASRALMPQRQTWVRRTDSGYLALAIGIDEQGGRYLQPLEAAWGLACPVLGADASALSQELAQALADDLGSWRVALLSGLPPVVRGSSASSTRSPPDGCCAADLSLGATSPHSMAASMVLARRTRSFRKSLRQSQAKARSAGISFVTASADAAVIYERVLAVEARSWKGRQGSGLTSPEMRAFYREMLDRLVRRGAQRVTFATLDGRDVAYILGGVFGDTYRGLQFSFDDDYRELGLGGLCQAHQIEALCADGIRRYDLGTEMEYKQRWGEIAFDTVMLIVQR